MGWSAVNHVYELRAFASAASSASASASQVMCSCAAVMTASLAQFPAEPVSTVGEPPGWSYPGVMTSSTVPTRRSHPVSESPWAFRRARMTATGWAVLLAPGALAGGVAVAAGRRARVVPLLVGIGAGAACSLLLARIVDEVRWRRSAVSLAVDEPDAALDLMQAVRAEGVRAEIVQADGAAGPSRRAYILRYRAKDDRRVRAVFAEQQG